MAERLEIRGAGATSIQRWKQQAPKFLSFWSCYLPSRAAGPQSASPQSAAQRWPTFNDQSVAQILEHAPAAHGYGVNPRVPLLQFKDGQAVARHPVAESTWDVGGLELDPTDLSATDHLGSNICYSEHLITERDLCNHPCKWSTESENAVRACSCLFPGQETSVGLGQEAEDEKEAYNSIRFLSIPPLEINSVQPNFTQTQLGLSPTSHDAPRIGTYFYYCPSLPAGRPELKKDKVQEFNAEMNRLVNSAQIRLQSPGGALSLAPAGQPGIKLQRWELKQSAIAQAPFEEHGNCNRVNPVNKLKAAAVLTYSMSIQVSRGSSPAQQLGSPTPEPAVRRRMDRCDSRAALTDNLLQTQMPDFDETIEKLFSNVSGLDVLSKMPHSQLEECAIQLWNWSVTKNAGGALSKVQKAKVRHAACSLLYCCEPENPTEGAIRKQILMASKTGRTWLDCKNPQMADHFLRLAVKSLETLYSQLMSRGDAAADVTSSKADVEKDLLRILSCQAESAVSQGNSGEATVYMQRCKDMLQRIPKDTAYLSLMCYNFGVDTYNLRKFEDSTFWLSQSYDIGKMSAKYGPGPDVLAKDLRLLATVYLEWDCQRFQEKALDAVILANKECVSTSGLYLKIRILLRSEAPDNHIRAGLDEMLESQVPLEVCLSAVKLLMSEDREMLAFDYLKCVCQQFGSSPDLGAALVLHVELLLQRNKELLAKQKIEDIITGHYSGKQLTPVALTSLHVILWDQASKHFEAGNYAEALQWYNYSFSFFKAGQMEPNLAKLQRNRASCLLHLQQLEKAKEAIKEAERSDPESIFTQFCIYKIAVQDDNVQKAAEALNAMGVLSKSPVSREDRLLLSESAASCLLCLAAQIALENGRQETAVKALEVLCENSKDEAHVLMGLRCLVRLVFSSAENSADQLRDVNLDKLLLYLKRALQTISLQPHMTAERRAEDANWFRRIAWNSALQCESRPDRMRDFFVLSYQLSLLCPPDRALLMGQRTSLLMAAAASLELCRTSPHSTQAEDLSLALEHIQACWEVCKTLKASGSGSYKYVHSLIKLSLPSGVSEVESRVLQELWDYFEDALSIISAAPDGFPEMETLWLLTQAWNAGILLYSLAQYHEAEKWCGLAMSFIRHLGSLRESYEMQMTGLYSEILDRLDKAKKNIHTEE
ncbi:hypothetical protein CCH79_00005643 [Gambusia affinis]|uniref:Protein ZIP4 homolog n=1 Tax=Gambusia affinis TaxID=33528 RepID=A0A315V6U3_GAMAF|nr:hypothetical protein CCH79_00005643 [Gambusia affinis]